MPSHGSVGYARETGTSPGRSFRCELTLESKFDLSEDQTPAPGLSATWRTVAIKSFSMLELLRQPGQVKVRGEVEVFQLPNHDTIRRLTGRTGQNGNAYPLRNELDQGV